MSSNLAVFGGLLKGVGTGIVDQAEQKRQAALERARLLARGEERAEDRQFQLERDQAASKERRGLLSTIDTDASGNRIAVDAAGNTKKLGYKAPASKTSGSPPADVAAADWLANRRAAAEGRPVTEQDRLDAFDTVRTAVDNPQQRATLVTRVYSDMKADMYDQRSDAEKQAAAKTFVDDLINSDKKSQAPAPKAQGLSGNLAANVDALSTPGPTKAKAAAMEKPNTEQPDDMGTREKPFEPTTEADFQKIPAGAIYLNPSDGKLYRKS